MSSVVISGDTSGAITLSAPAIAGTNTITLPAQTATIATLTTPSFATTIGVGGATAAASGAGITFPASQSASTDANTLDDYEEGTWTPTLRFGGATTGITYVYQNGLYTKVGNLVFIRVTIVLTSKGAATGSATVTGLPFTTNSTVGGAGFNVNYYGTSSSINGQVFTQSEASTTTIDIRQKTPTLLSDLTNSNFENDTNFQFSGCYQT